MPMKKNKCFTLLLFPLVIIWKKPNYTEMENDAIKVMSLINRSYLIDHLWDILEDGYLFSPLSSSLGSLNKL